MFAENNFSNKIFIEDNILYTNENIKLLDFLAIQSGISENELIKRAGKKIAEKIACEFYNKNIIFLCGKGNNGKDGVVAAKYLILKGFNVSIYLFSNNKNKINIYDFDNNIIPQISSLTLGVLKKFSLIVDALIGVGKNKVIKGKLAEIIKLVNHTKRKVVSIDVPSGLDCNSGLVDKNTIKSDLTITFEKFKPGHFLLPGREYCGNVVLYSIKIPKKIHRRIKTNVYANNPSLWISSLPTSTYMDYKSKKGHVVMLGGKKDYLGAARLASYSALRAGVGLATIMVNEKHVSLYSKDLFAPMIHPIKSNSSSELLNFYNKTNANTIVIGPGLGEEYDIGKILDVSIARSKNIVLDADALNYFEGKANKLKKIIKNCKNNLVLTPHEGEFKKLFGDFRMAKIERAKYVSKFLQSVVILKGSDTIIASPDNRISINYNAPPSLATAGSGDVLAGIVGGLLAQGVKSFEAASIAVWIHGHAASLFGKGLIADDLIDLIPQAWGALINKVVYDA